MGFFCVFSCVAVCKLILLCYLFEVLEPGAGKTIRVVRAVKVSPRPLMRPGSDTPAPSEELLVAMAETIEQAVTAAQVDPLPEPAANELAIAAGTAIKPTARPVAATTITPTARPATNAVTTTELPSIETAALEEDTDPPLEVVTRVSTSGGRLWGINVGRFTTRHKAERVLLQTALAELGTLDTALRKVASSSQGHDANFVGMTKEGAARACRRLSARNIECTTLGPSQG